uniref:class I SAM-dependent methyltransferase n=1 Tax=Stappia sp. TaxID=1870903 RepID=UPI003BAD80D5
MDRPLDRLLTRLIRTGTLTFSGPGGTTRTYGDGTGTPVHVAIRTRRAALAIALDPMLAAPEAYMDGDLEVVQGDLLDFLKVVFLNMGDESAPSLAARTIDRLRMLGRRLHQYNPAGRATRNIQHHYDLSADFYRLFLDEDMQYSCAYFASPDAGLDEAQLAKKRHIAAKLAMRPGLRVLDIGSGWGGMGLYLARGFDASVTGVTLSRDQHEVSRARAEAEGLAARASFELRDYRSLSQRYDRIVSVGMFEHVGVSHYRQFFETCARLLDDDGVMLLHSIGRSGVPGATNPFIRKYIFPGGYMPALSEVLPVIERTGLVVTDVEILRLHYAETLKHWRQRFHARWKEAAERFDERFCRMWDFYLAGSEAAFRWQDLMVFQIQIAKTNHTLPVTRDYMAREEAALIDAAPAFRQAGSGDD